MAKNITSLNRKNFGEFVGKGTSVVDFWASWCGPCIMMAPIFEEVAEELKGKIKFGKLNVDEETAIAQEFEVFSIPTIIIFKEGEQVERSVGAISREELLNLIKSVK